MNRLDRLVVEYRKVLKATERLNAQELLQYQRNLLVPLLQHASRNVPFYAERLAPVIQGDDIAWDRWHEIPLLTRDSLQDRFDEFQAKRLPPHAGRITDDQTTGSTGKPLRHRKNELVLVATLGMTDRGFRWWKFDGNKTLGSFVSTYWMTAPPPEGMTMKGWRSGYPRGKHHVIDMTAHTEVQLDWLMKRRPDYLSAYTVTLRQLAERARERGCDLSFKRIIARGSILTDETRELCEEVFGARVLDQYGSDEIGMIACECPHCGLYHHSAEAVLIEILDDDNKPCAPGVPGRVVLTLLYNYAMPLIRYEIEDFARLGPEEPDCRIKLPTFTEIVGRYRNAMVLPGGRTVFPKVRVAQFRKYLSARQIQMVQRDPSEIEVRYVPLDPEQAPDEKGLEAFLREEFDKGLNVTVTAVDEIPRSPGGKFEDFLSLLPQGKT